MKRQCSSVLGGACFDSSQERVGKELGKSLGHKNHRNSNKDPHKKTQISNKNLTFPCKDPCCGSHGDIWERVGKELGKSWFLEKGLERVILCCFLQRILQKLKVGRELIGKELGKSWSHKDPTNPHKNLQGLPQGSLQDRCGSLLESLHRIWRRNSFQTLSQLFPKRWRYQSTYAPPNFL